MICCRLGWPGPTDLSSRGARSGVPTHSLSAAPVGDGTLYGMLRHRAAAALTAVAAAVAACSAPAHGIVAVSATDTSAASGVGAGELPGVPEHGTFGRGGIGGDGPAPATPGGASSGRPASTTAAGSTRTSPRPTA